LHQSQWDKGIVWDDLHHYHPHGCHCPLQRNHWLSSSEELLGLAGAPEEAQANVTLWVQGAEEWGVRATVASPEEQMVAALASSVTVTTGVKVVEAHLV